jgi:glucose/arabinose dehydrogenase
MRTRIVAAAVAALAGLAASVAMAWPHTEDASGNVVLRRVASGLGDALDVTSPPGDPRLFVVQQSGRILLLDHGKVLPRPFLDVRGLISAGGERGLLGLAFHPDYAHNGRFYVDYTNRAGDTRVVEYRVSSNRNRANPGSARVLLAIPQPYPNHNGGDVVFGPDGMLYVGMGDGGSGGDPQGNGQSLGTLLGKLLRIDVDHRQGDLPYAIPADNPFRDTAGARPEIYAFGLRNPWRFSFDRTRGDLWIGDVGQNQWEEIDYVPRGKGAGANFGWSALEGRHRYSSRTVEGGHYVGPVAEYSHAVGNSVTGGFVYRGTAVPSLRGRYVYADYASGRVWTMRAGPKPGQPTEITNSLGVELSAVTSFGQGSGGELYVIANGGVLYRFAAG